MLPDLVLAPIAEVTTPAFRSVIRSFSKKVLLHSEMLSAASVLRGAMYNTSKVNMYEFDPPFSFQLLGNDPSLIGDAAELLSKKNPFSIDINLGCSAPDIRRKGQGGALFAKPELVKKIVSAARKKTPVYLSAKIRTGIDQFDFDEIMSYAKMLQDEGCDYITVHPRTAKQGFKRLADWNIIKRINEEITIPVVGNGDIASAENAKKRIEEGYCDSVMIARAAIQKPWIFKEYEVLKNGSTELKTIDLFETAAFFTKQLKALLPEDWHMSRSLRFFAYYCKNFKFGHVLFSKIRNVKSPDDMLTIIQEYLEKNTEERIIQVLHL